MPMLRVSDPDGTLRAVVVNYACHCTTMGGQFNKIAGDRMEIDGDPEQMPQIEEVTPAERRGMLAALGSLLLCVIAYFVQLGGVIVVGAMQSG